MLFPRVKLLDPALVSLTNESGSSDLVTSRQATIASGPAALIVYTEIGNAGCTLFGTVIVAKLFQQPLITTPIRLHLDPQIEEDLAPDQLFDFLA